MAKGSGSRDLGRGLSVQNQFRVRPQLGGAPPRRPDRCAHGPEAMISPSRAKCSQFQPSQSCKGIMFEA